MDMQHLLQDPVTWVAAAFFIFMAGFLKLALPHIVKGLDSKSAQIAHDIEEAARLRDEAMKLLEEYKAKQLAMQAEAKAMLEHAQKEAITMKADAEVALKASIERRTKLAHDKIARAESDAVESIKRSVVEAASLAAFEAATAQAQSNSDALIDQALVGVERLVH